jgi:hypothetical protein
MVFGVSGVKSVAHTNKIPVLNESRTKLLVLGSLQLRNSPFMVA